MNDQTLNKKAVTAYVNTTRIHWLVEELQKKGIKEIMVSEFFRPDSQISKLEFYCAAIEAESICEVIKKVGTNGNAPDYYFSVNDIAGNPESIFPFM